MSPTEYAARLALLAEQEEDGEITPQQATDRQKLALARLCGHPFASVGECAAGISILKSLIEFGDYAEAWPSLLQAIASGLKAPIIPR